MPMSRVELIKDLTIFLNCSIGNLIINGIFIKIKIDETFVITSITTGISEIIRITIKIFEIIRIIIGIFEVILITIEIFEIIRDFCVVENVERFLFENLEHKKDLV